MAAKSKKPVVKLKADDISLASGIAQKFNIAARDAKSRQIAVTLTKAAAFLASVADDIAAGDIIYTGSAWHDDVFLDQKKVAAIAGQQPDPALAGLSRNFTVTKKSKADLEKVRAAFNLKDEAAAAHLCLEAYSRLCDGLRRGNSFLMETARGSQKPFSARKFASVGKAGSGSRRKSADKGSPKTGGQA